MFTSSYHEQFQNWYNTAVIGLASQGFVRSVIEGTDKCRYRGSNKTKCAVGYLIPDERYNPLIEGDNIKVPSVQKCVDPERTLSYKEIEFLNELQRCHDDGETHSYMKTRLSALAIRYSLDIPKEICL